MHQLVKIMCLNEPRRVEKVTARFYRLSQVSTMNLSLSALKNRKRDTKTLLRDTKTLLKLTEPPKKDTLLLCPLSSVLPSEPGLSGSTLPAWYGLR